MRWFSADLHLGHSNIIRYCNRPFADVDAMNDGIIQRWNDVVATDDEVFVLGDVAMGRLQGSLPLVARLHGHKILIPGNHDRCWRHAHASSRDWHQAYLDAGFQEVHHDPAPLRIAGQDVLLSHFPYSGDSHHDDRFQEHRPLDTGCWLLHGHVHDVWRQRGRQINVGQDAWRWRPVSQPELEELITANERDLPPLS